MKLFKSSKNHSADKEYSRNLHKALKWSKLARITYLCGVVACNDVSKISGRLEMKSAVDVEYFFDVDSILGVSVDDACRLEFDLTRKSSGRDVNTNIILEEADGIKFIQYVTRFFDEKVDDNGEVLDIDFPTLNFTDGSTTLLLFPVSRKSPEMRIIGRSESHSIGVTLNEFEISLIAGMSEKLLQACENIEKVSTAAEKLETIGT